MPRLIYRPVEIGRLVADDTLVVVAHYWLNRSDYERRKPPHVVCDHYFVLPGLASTELPDVVHSTLRAYCRSIVDLRRSGDHTVDPTKPAYERGRRIRQRVPPERLALFARGKGRDPSGRVETLRPLLLKRVFEVDV